MDTRFQDIRPVLRQGILLSTAGVLITTVLTGLFIYYITAWYTGSPTLPMLTSLLLAATMSSTDSASVFSLLRSQKMNLKENLRPMLELESGSNDPMAYMLTIALIQVISSGSELHVGLIARIYSCSSLWEALWDMPSDASPCGLSTGSTSATVRFIRSCC